MKKTEKWQSKGVSIWLFCRVWPFDSFVRGFEDSTHFATQLAFEMTLKTSEFKHPSKVSDFLMSEFMFFWQPR